MPLRCGSHLGLLALLLWAAVPTHAASAPAPTATTFDLQRPDIRAFISDTAARHDLPEQDIVAVLADARSQPSIIAAMQRPAERVLPWWQYRERFLDAARIRNGLQFWQAQRQLLEQIEQARGVPAEYLVAIVGVETQWGRVTGRHKALDALSTLAFDYPPRSAFFQGELQNLLLLARDTGRDPRSLRGSYAGALGAPQFMPSSYRRYAVDHGGDGSIDLWNDWGDVLASVANFLVVHGWRSGEPVMATAHINHEADDPLDFQLVLKDTVEKIRARGYRIESDAPAAAPAVLVPAEQADSMGWRVGFQNFWVITRYNRSPRYAMAVHDLALALRQQMHTPPEAP